ncbi:MAG: AAA family ATPase [Planctomycetes bacterium]|nr:AAA family ATPase [Planctomycetota bacterium]
MKSPDENDRLRDGTLPADPRDGLALVELPVAATEAEALCVRPLAVALASPRDPIEAVARGLLHRPSIALLAGSKGSGKSTILHAVALDLAAGSPVLGEFKVGRPFRVLVVSLEHPPALVERTWQELVTGRGGEVPDGLLVRYRDERPGIDLFDPSSVDRLRRTIEREKIEALGLDTITRCHSAKENDSGEMTRVMQALEDLRDDFRLLILGTHHTRKAGVRGDDADLWERVRGSGAIIAAVETVLSVEGGTEDRRLSVRSNIPGVVPHVGLSYARDGEAGSIVLRSIPLKDTKQRIVEAVGDGASTRAEIAEVLGVEAKSEGFRRALRAAVNSRAVHEDRTGKRFVYRIGADVGTPSIFDADGIGGGGGAYSTTPPSHRDDGVPMVSHPEKDTSSRGGEA